MSGAFVAGLDAGLIYNEFPLMGGQWVPEDLINPRIKPAYKNMFEHDVTVQFQHRVLATVTYASILGLTALAYRGRRGLSPRARAAANTLAAVGTAQVILGISTLLTFVPTPLAATHQAGSLTLLSVAIWLLHELKKLPK
ncbi:cytochrome c oxidase assembly protein [Heterostelium album PN500]|uniref:Cytochrome c oxidase assembly protein n=1 Tax=Heterostelium pallidum (strain ATCC 26659 / Pp 5 / PN500) TaxID=670386 RepID=D3BJT6_HETP5|nr:cytochrome c oxidase assembly protein [Heterostelium album PN500]EFA78166.1 cytochrome c oxidase assembly protein [Heterostelium album PN500]|eukprot:XP_020430292.1 cytochrome c oxidase assembly protein [Heterostelium album PN500]